MVGPTVIREKENPPKAEDRQLTLVFLPVRKRIFILEGIATVVISVPLYTLLPDDPSTAKFLSPDERQFLVLRLRHEPGQVHFHAENSDKMSFRQVLAALRDWRIYIAVVCTGCPQYSYKYQAW